MLFTNTIPINSLLCTFEKKEIYGTHIFKKVKYVDANRKAKDAWLNNTVISNCGIFIVFRNKK